MKKHIPNLLTIARLVLTGVMFAAQAAIVARLGPAHLLALIALVAFVVAAVTDFFDGFLARRWAVVSTAGAILDPIADKVLVCGAILGLVGLGAPGVLIPGTLILFREFAVSAMREVLAPKGMKLPVTFLAKTKTALQLVALGVWMALVVWNVWPGVVTTPLFARLTLLADVLLWAAAAATVWTGVEYALAARRALASQR